MVDCKAVSRVKRCLFGRADHNSVRAELVKQLAVIIKQDKEKYNFDFSTGEPLEGELKWEKVEAVPSTMTTIPSSDSSLPVTVPECIRLPTAEHKTPAKKSTTKASKESVKNQPSIRDFLPTKKRIGSLKRQNSGLVMETLPIKRMHSQQS